MPLSDLDKAYIKKCLGKIIPVVVLIFLIPLVVFVFDWDFSIRERYLETDDKDIPESIVKTPIKMQNVEYDKKLGLLITDQVQITGKLLGSNTDMVRTNCPFQKERVGLYNKYFTAIILSVKGKREDFAVTPQGRVVKQLLKKLATDQKYLEKFYEHKITLVGYYLILKEYLDIRFRHLVVTKVILDGKVYQ